MLDNPEVIRIISSDGTSSYDNNLINNTGFISQGGSAITTNELVTTSLKEVPEPTSSIGFMLFGLGAYLKKKISTN